MKNFNFLKIIFIIVICNCIAVKGESFHKENPKPKKV